MSRGAAVFGGQISLDEIPSDFRANGSSAHAKDVHVIVLDALLRRKMIVNETGADAVHFVRATDAPTPLPQIATPRSTLPATTA